MRVTLYADVLFFINFSMDFISLYAASLVENAPRRGKRMCLGAALGAAYGVIAVIYIPSGFFTYLSSAAASYIMCYAAFGGAGGPKQLFRRSAVVFGVGALIGGLMTALLSLFGKSYTYAGENMGGTSAAAVFAVIGTIVIILILKTRKTCLFVTVTVWFRCGNITFRALNDSGNLLRDPISGDPVIIVSSSLLSKVIPAVVLNALMKPDAGYLAGQKIPFRFIRHKTGTGEKMACAVLPERILINNGKSEYEVRALILPTDVGEDYFASYPATVPSSLIYGGIGDIIGNKHIKNNDERKITK